MNIDNNNYYYNIAELAVQVKTKHLQSIGTLNQKICQIQTEKKVVITISNQCSFNYIILSMNCTNNAGHLRYQSLDEVRHADDSTLCDTNTSSDSVDLRSQGHRVRLQWPAPSG